VERYYRTLEDLLTNDPIAREAVWKDGDVLDLVTFKCCCNQRSTQGTEYVKK